MRGRRYARDSLPSRDLRDSAVERTKKGCENSVNCGKKLAGSKQGLRLRSPLALLQDCAHVNCGTKLTGGKQEPCRRSPLALLQDRH